MPYRSASAPWRRLLFVCVPLLLSWAPARAIMVAGGWDRGSDVVTAASFNGVDGLWTYAYTVLNTSVSHDFFDGPTWYPVIVDYELPLNSPTDIGDIQDPFGWFHETFTAGEYATAFGMDNPFGAPYVLHWYTGNVQQGDPTVYAIYPTEHPSLPDQLGGFSFRSTIAPVDGPYSTSWSIDGLITGDPPIPGTTAVGSVFRDAGVPEPATLVVLGSALLLLRRRRSI